MNLFISWRSASCVRTNTFFVSNIARHHGRFRTCYCQCRTIPLNCSTLDKSLDYFSLNKEEKKLSGKRLNIISLKNDLLIDENAKNTELVLSVHKSTANFNFF